MASNEQNLGTIIAVRIAGCLIVVALVVIAILAAVLVVNHMNKNKSEWHDCFSREHDIQIQQLLLLVCGTASEVAPSLLVHISVRVYVPVVQYSSFAHHSQKYNCIAWL